MLPLLAFSQKQGNIWYFGNHAGLNFNAGVPSSVNDGQTYSPDGSPIEGTSVISDSSGSLLFYTNGMKIWDKTHSVMPNGNNLLGNFSSTQSCLIIPQPGSSRYYYVFTTDDYYEDNLQFGFRYSKVDICLNGGLGDILTNEKNIKLLDTVCEKLTVVKHSNDTDYWIIVHKYYSDAFYSFRLTANGILDTVISHSGSRHPLLSLPPNITGYAIGQMKPSPDGSKLAIVSGNGFGIAEYFNFNNSTGIIDNDVNIQTDSVYNYYGVSFSPDNSKLYITCILNNIGLYQFNLNSGNGNADSVLASKTQITASNGYFGMQLGPDNKIYIAQTNSQYLAVIDNPNNLGLSCNFQDSAIYLNGMFSSFGLPNMIESYNYSNTINDCGTGLEKSTFDQLVTIFPNPNNGSFQLQCELNNNESGMLVIYDLSGKQILSKVLPAGCKSISFSEELSSGMYQYNVMVNGKVVKRDKLAVSNRSK